MLGRLFKISFPPSSCIEPGKGRPGAPLQGGLGTLCHPHRGQPVPGRKDEVSRHLQRGQHRGRPNHRRRRQPPADLRVFGAGPGGVAEANWQGEIATLRISNPDWAASMIFVSAVRILRCRFRSQERQSHGQA